MEFEPNPLLFRNLGMQVFTDENSRSALCELNVSKENVNRWSFLHGGVIATLLDTASGVTASLSGDASSSERFVTISLNIDYVGTVREGVVRAEAKIVGGSKSIKFISCELRDENGRLLATSNGVFKRVSAPVLEASE